jgi:hypothetical protein
MVSGHGRLLSDHFFNAPLGIWCPNNPAGEVVRRPADRTNADRTNNDLDG